MTDADEFRLQTLSGYSRKLHKPLDEFLKNKELFIENKEEDGIDGLLDLSKEEDDLLAFVNSL